jgi:hypothetical protein
MIEEVPDLCVAFCHGFPLPCGYSTDRGLTVITAKPTIRLETRCRLRR